MHLYFVASYQLLSIGRNAWDNKMHGDLALRVDNPWRDGYLQPKHMEHKGTYKTLKDKRSGENGDKD